MSAEPVRDSRSSSIVAGAVSAYTDTVMADYTTIVELRNDAEARLLDAHLNERGIPHVVESFHDSAYDGIFQVQLGWGHIRAPEEYREEILEIYEDLTGTA